MHSLSPPLLQQNLLSRAAGASFLARLASSCVRRSRSRFPVPCTAHASPPLTRFCSSRRSRSCGALFTSCARSHNKHCKRDLLHSRRVAGDAISALRRTSHAVRRVLLQPACTDSCGTCMCKAVTCARHLHTLTAPIVQIAQERMHLEGTLILRQLLPMWPQRSFAVAGQHSLRAFERFVRRCGCRQSSIAFSRCRLFLRHHPPLSPR